MNKTFYLTVFCILLLTQINFGQAQPKNAEQKSQPGSEQKQNDYPSLKVQAEELGKATVSGNFGKIIDYTHPKIVTLAGGKDKMTASLKSDFAQMKAEGFEMISLKVGEVKQIEKIGDELFAVLLINLTMKVPNGKLAGESSLIGVSGDSGANWKFINGIEQERFKAMFPKAAEKIRIPAEQQPKPIENK